MQPRARHRISAYSPPRIIGQAWVRRRRFSESSPPTPIVPRMYEAQDLSVALAQIEHPKFQRKPVAEYLRLLHSQIPRVATPTQFVLQTAFMHCMLLPQSLHSARSPHRDSSLFGKLDFAGLRALDHCAIHWMEPFAPQTWFFQTVRALNQRKESWICARKARIQVFIRAIETRRAILQPNRAKPACFSVEQFEEILHAHRLHLQREKIELALGVLDRPEIAAFTEHASEALRSSCPGDDAFDFVLGLIQPVPTA